jgi:hypothetical protein
VSSAYDSVVRDLVVHWGERSRIPPMKSDLAPAAKYFAIAAPITCRLLRSSIDVILKGTTRPSLMDACFVRRNSEKPNSLLYTLETEP